MTALILLALLAVFVFLFHFLVENILTDDAPQAYDTADRETREPSRRYPASDGYDGASGSLAAGGDGGSGGDSGSCGDGGSGGCH